MWSMTLKIDHVAETKTKNCEPEAHNNWTNGHRDLNLQTNERRKSRTCQCNGNEFSLSVSAMGQGIV